MDKTYLDSFLDENEQLALGQFVGSDVMREAVRKVMLAGLYTNGTMQPTVPPQPLYNGAYDYVSGLKGEFTNDEVGSRIRAQWDGLKTLETAFEAMTLYVQTPVKVDETENPAV